MNDWQEAYYDLVNKVECECVKQGDLVPIWEQFKALASENERLTLAVRKLQGNQAALEARVRELEGALARAIETLDEIANEGGGRSINSHLARNAIAAIRSMTEGETKP